MKNFITFSRSIEFKFYAIIFVASILVAVLGFNLYNDAKSQILTLSNKNKIATTTSIVNIFNSWIKERTQVLSVMADIIKDGDDEWIEQVTKTLFERSSEFDAVQFLTEDNKIFLNGKRINRDAVRKYSLSSLVWYQETKLANAPTVNFITHHVVLKHPTINICVPSHSNGKFSGVLCGIVRLSNIFANIENLKLAPNVYTFLITHSGEILTPMPNEQLKSHLQTRFREMFLNGENARGIEIDSKFISLSGIPSLNWFVGASADDEQDTIELLGAAQSSALMLFLSFILLVLVANSLHNMLYQRVKVQNDEYEILLTHKNRMSETGELVAGINHQFIQPVNSLNLMISSLLMLEREGKLDGETLREILKGGEGSVKMLKDTIDVFRNFYKTSENVAQFSLAQSIKNLLMLMHTELSKNNVSVEVEPFVDIQIAQKENIVQQILLILLHNAKDALVERYDEISKRKINISVKYDDSACFVSVIDLGGGIDTGVVRKIFDVPKTTKASGNGIGLYFGKKLAIEKLQGDLKLVSSASPTIFELSFSRNLKG